MQTTQSNIAESKLKKAGYYPDKLSLVENNPESLTVYSKRVINFKTIERLKVFAQINPIQFRRLWLLFQYQDFKLSMDFQTAISIIKSYVQARALGARDPEYITAPNRRQILGVLREQKIRGFIDFYKYLAQQTQGEFDIFNYAANAPIEELLFVPTQIDFNSDNNLTPIDSIFGKSYKLPRQIWNLILNSVDNQLLASIDIPLPRVDAGPDSKFADLAYELSCHLPTTQGNDLEEDLEDLLSIFEG